MRAVAIVEKGESRPYTPPARPSPVDINEMLTNLVVERDRLAAEVERLTALLLKAADALEPFADDWRQEVQALDLSVIAEAILSATPENREDNDRDFERASNTRAEILALFDADDSV